MQDLKDYYETRDGAIWLRPFLDQKSRKVADDFEDEDSAVKALHERYLKFKSEAEELVKTIDAAANKGSFLVKTNNFISDLLQHCGLGDYKVLYEMLVDRRDEIEAQIQENRKRNLQIKEALLEEASVLETVEDIKQAVLVMKDIRQRWIKTGDVVPDEKERVEGEFQRISDLVHDKNKLHIAAAISEYEAKIDRVKEVIASSNDNKEKAEQLKQIQKDWKKLPGLPANAYKPLWSTFSKLNNDFFSEFQSKRKEEALQSGIETKQKILAEVIGLQKTPEKVQVDDLKKYRNDWKKLPFLRTEQEEELFEQFNYELEKLNELSKLGSFTRRLSEKEGLNPDKIISEKIKHLKRLIRKEEENLKRMTDNLGMFRINPRSKGKGLQKVMEAKTDRKDVSLAVKKDLLKELKNS